MELETPSMFATRRNPEPLKQEVQDPQIYSKLSPQTLQSKPPTNLSRKSSEPARALLARQEVGCHRTERTSWHLTKKAVLAQPTSWGLDLGFRLPIYGLIVLAFCFQSLNLAPELSTSNPKLLNPRHSRFVFKALG